MAKSATTGKWNMSGRYQAYNAGGAAPQHQQQAPAQAQTPQQRQSQQQQAETIPTLGKILAASTPPPIQKPVMPELPQMPLPPSSTEAPPTQSGIGRLVQQRKDTQKSS
jgi:hypothetical protein